MKKEIKILKDADKHPIDSYLVDSEGNHECYSCICNKVGREIHKKVDNDMRLMNIVIILASIALYVTTNSLFLVPMLFCILAFVANMAIDKHEQLLYFRMEECEYYEDTVYLFNKSWNKYRWFNKAIWCSFILGVLSFVLLFFI